VPGAFTSDSEADRAQASNLIDTGVKTLHELIIGAANDASCLTGHSNLD
jgi:hypothetical protein